MSPTARRRTRYLVLAAAVVVQLVVLYVPRVPEVGAVAVPGGDKIVHAAVFAAVTLAGLRAGLSPAVVAAFGVAHAGVSELLQHTVLPARSGDPFDVLADLAGVALGALAAWWLAGRESRPDDVRGGAPGRSGRGRSGPWR